MNLQLVSGGLDSIMLDHWLNDQGIPHDKLWVGYGQTEEKEEEAATRSLWPDACFVKVAGADASKVGRYFPNRNLWLASSASLFLNADTIWMAGLQDDRCADKNEDAFDRMGDVLSRFAGHKVEVKSPFWQTDKSTAVFDYLRSGGSEKRLLSSWSCYDPKDGKQCLACEACFRWSVALRSNGLNVAPPNADIIRTYLKKLHEYEPKRVWSTLKGIQTDKQRVVTCDIDGTLTVETEGWDYENRTLLAENAVDLNKIYNAGHWVILWSSRRSVDRGVTERWLRDNGVHYHGMLLDKTPYNLNIDDLTWNPNTFEPMPTL